MHEVIYKVMEAGEWREAQAVGVYHGSADDARDGFIHLSTADQLPGTLAKHFAGQDGLVLVAVDAAALGEKLVWEPSRRGDLFPHLYGALPTDAALWSTPVALGEDGAHELPADLPGKRGAAS
jgi:uncharacterized protein (DUF952 family)